MVSHSFAWTADASLPTLERYNAQYLGSVPPEYVISRTYRSSHDSSVIKARQPINNTEYLEIDVTVLGLLAPTVDGCHTATATS